MSGRHLMWLCLCALGVLGDVAPAASRQSELKHNPASIQGLLAALEDPDTRVAVNALGLLGAEGVHEDPQLRKRLQSFTREPRFLDQLKDSDEEVRRKAAWALENLGEAAQEHAPRLVDLLKDPDRYVRNEAAAALSAMGKAAREQAPRLGDLLNDPNAEVRRAAAEALGAMGETAQAHAPLLGNLLNDPDASVRMTAAKALKAMGGAAQAQAPRLVDLLSDPDASIRSAAAEALGAMGEAAQAQAPRLVDLLNDPNAKVRRAAISALGAMGEAAHAQAPRLVDLLIREAKEQVPTIVELVRISDEEPRSPAARALGAMGKAARAQLPRLADLLKDPDSNVRSAAASALEAMGEAAREQVPLLVDLLKDPEADVRGAAALALGSMGEAAREQVPLLVDLLKDPDADVRSAAAGALGALGEVAREQAPLLVDLSKDPDPDVRSAAAGALGAMGKAAQAQAPRLGDLLKDPDRQVRIAAANALGAMGEAAREQVPLLVDLLKDPEINVPNAATRALRNMGKATREQAPRLAELLKDPNALVRSHAAWMLSTLGEAAREQVPFVLDRLEDEEDGSARALEGLALTTMAPLDLQHISVLLAMAGTDPVARREWLLRAHIAGGGAPQVERVLRWVSGRTSKEFPEKLSLEEARETLRAFAELWPHTGKRPVLRDDLAQQIARVANLANGQWASADIELLELHQENLKASYPMHAANLRAAIDSVERWQSLRTFAWTWAGHLAFWVLLLFFYPRSPQVQAVFFWNPWVRTITGFGYVGLLLTWVPFLRRRLLAPFKDQLLADADLERFSPESYFQDSEVVLQPSGRREPLLTALPHLRGQVVLEGASGLGKSLFIKYLLRHSKPLAVYLSAERCKDGVLEAIQAKLEGHAKDSAFLQSIIYSGALDIYIDGLNEVTADTRARIVQFVERNFHGNILLATQRMEWTPPTTARLYVLQPLSEARISGFLVSREPLLGEKARLRGAEYREACERFVQRALSPEQPEELRVAMREVLSNPMDLTVIAQMLAEGHSPDLFRLRQQQYELMARDYLEVNLAEFPLKELAEESYTLRLEDRPSLPEDRFGKELLRLEAFKMVVRRQWKGPDGKEHREWRFRHDKLQEFFIAQTFLGANNPRIVEHMDDPRFRGVYFLLALLLEPDSARHLRDLLVVRAARTRDHTVSDEFVTLLEARRGAEQAQLALPKNIAATGT